MRSISASICILVLLFCIPAFADEMKMKDNPACKQWHSVVGEWKAEIESRKSPSEEWTESSRTYQIKWILDGNFIEISGRTSTGINFIEIMGYDPISKSHYSSAFDDTGYRWNVISGGWDDNTWNGVGQRQWNDGTVHTGQCSIEFENSQFRSGKAECKAFSKGKWFQNERSQHTKIR